ncbi:Transforming acidic coiled-coil-containing protein 2 [Trichinella pseudospiralis]|uniref:Transforming acidic coiled-coil-containing protein 2 n=1 Tax=Trichinella pseudospiralis TaxID=6337 RepID=A0A0V1K4V2_TRIPS|nr:Transforming acidic coiled-coil-containing protein 2 [Trichinella pseudospiralis]
MAIEPSSGAFIEAKAERKEPIGFKVNLYEIKKEIEMYAFNDLFDFYPIYLVQNEIVFNACLSALRHCVAMQSDDDSCDRLDTEDGQFFDAVESPILPESCSSVYDSTLDFAAVQFARCSMKLMEFPEISSDENSLSSGVTANLKCKQLELEALFLKNKELSVRREILQKEKAAVLKENEALDKQIAEMKIVVADYETAFEAQQENEFLISDEKLDEVRAERNELRNDLQIAENAISNLQKVYDRLRKSVDQMRQNELLLNSAIDDCRSKYRESEERFVQFTAYANNEIEEAEKKAKEETAMKEATLLELRMKCKFLQLQMETLEKTRQRKNEEIRELTLICDSLLKNTSLEE